jgi:hypothetical protein
MRNFYLLLSASLVGSSLYWIRIGNSVRSSVYHHGVAVQNVVVVEVVGVEIIIIIVVVSIATSLLLLSASLAATDVDHGQFARLVGVGAVGVDLRHAAAAGGDQSEFARGRPLCKLFGQRRQEDVDLGVRVDLVRLRGCGPDAHGHHRPRQAYLEQNQTWHPVKQF